MMAGLNIFSTIAFWSIFGTIIGLLIGLVAYFGLRRVGSFQWGFENADQVRSLVLLYYIIALPVAFGIVGLLQGTYALTEQLVTGSEFLQFDIPLLSHAVEATIAKFLVAVKANFRIYQFRWLAASVGLIFLPTLIDAISYSRGRRTQPFGGRVIRF